MTNKLIGVFLIGLLTGCSTTPSYDARFGDAVREARKKMTLNSDAAGSADQAAGMDGMSAKEAATRYQDSFKAPPPVMNVINIGGSIGKGK